jgi:2-polyprenyl-3-methyl-5-hydroxy-6-metoxy-1,4-benzoquinol methylase
MGTVSCIGNKTLIDFPTQEKCLVCGCTEYGVLSDEYAHAYLVRCTNCSLVFGQRIASADELNDHYGKYPRNNTLSPLTVKRYEELLDQFEPYRRTNRLLDIGCGDGHFLAVAKSRGWEVYGTEFTVEAVEVCHKKGIEMHQGIIQSWKSVHDFDVVTSFEVLEHITDGREHASAIHSLLRTGGLFYFTTPNFNSFSRRWLGGKWKIIEYPEHLCYYTAKTINRLLVDHKLAKLNLLTTGITLRQFPSETSHYAEREEELRTSIEGNKFLSFAKRTINWWLSAFNLGDTLKGYYVKP